MSSGRVLDGLLRELFGCQWGPEGVSTADDEVQCERSAVQIVVVHGDGAERAFKLCAEHRDRVLGATVPRGEYWRWGGKDYGWSAGVPGVLVAEHWCPAGAKPDPALWGHDDAQSPGVEDPRDRRNERAVGLLHELRDLCEENSAMGEQINVWLEELRDG